MQEKVWKIFSIAKKPCFKGPPRFLRVLLSIFFFIGLHGHFIHRRISRRLFVCQPGHLFNKRDSHPVVHFQLARTRIFLYFATRSLTHLRRCRNSLAEAVTEYPLKSQSLEWRPRHGSLPLVFLRAEPWRLDLLFWTGVADGRVGLVGLAMVAGWECTGGRAMLGDLLRLWHVASRERLRERPRRRAEMAPKKDSSVGEVALRWLCDVGEAGGESWPAEDCDCCESNVFVRTGRGMGWLGVAIVVDVGWLIGWLGG